MLLGMTHPLETYLKQVPGETRGTLARRADISEMHLSRLIRGKGEVSTKTLRAVSQATGGLVSVADLVKPFEQNQSKRSRIKSKKAKPVEREREPTAA